MVIVMKNDATADQIEAVEQKIRASNLSVHRVDGALRTILGAIGDASVVDVQEFENMEGVFNVVRIMEPYKLCSRTFHPENSIIKFNGLELGGDRIVVMAGPCSIESEEQINTIAEQVARAGATILRGGAPGWCNHITRWRVQAPNVSLRLPGNGSGGIKNHATGRRCL